MIKDITEKITRQEKELGQDVGSRMDQATAPESKSASSADFKILATLIAVYGFVMPPLGWSWAGFVWGYALMWALLSDRIKLFAYKILDPTAPICHAPAVTPL